MRSISIARAKELREEFGAMQLIVFAIDDVGGQHIATHGASEQDARKAADAGNNLKKALGWPEKDCKAVPVMRMCKNCTFYKPDYGMFCFNGWSKRGEDGNCCLNPKHVHTTEENKCQFFQPR